MAHTSTLVPETVSKKSREKTLQSKLNEFGSAKIVICDRLHAMIFAAITKTPCIAFDNVSKKVSGVYKWIEGLDYVKCVNNLDEAKLWLPTLLGKQACDYAFEYPYEEVENILRK